MEVRSDENPVACGGATELLDNSPEIEREVPSIIGRPTGRSGRFLGGLRTETIVAEGTMSLLGLRKVRAIRGWHHAAIFFQMCKSGNVVEKNS